MYLRYNKSIFLIFVVRYVVVLCKAYFSLYDDGWRLEEKLGREFLGK
jgi:hypothetical protein